MIITKNRWEEEAHRQVSERLTLLLADAQPGQTQTTRAVVTRCFAQRLQSEITTEMQQAARDAIIERMKTYLVTKTGSTLGWLFFYIWRSWVGEARLDQNHAPIHTAVAEAVERGLLAKSAEEAQQSLAALRANKPTPPASTHFELAWYVDRAIQPRLGLSPQCNLTALASLLQELVAHPSPENKARLVKELEEIDPYQRTVPV